MLFIEKIAEERIRQAQEKGEFDNLPGVGKPQKLDDDSMVPRELRMAYRILKNAGYVPPEVSLRNDIQQLEQLIALTDDAEEKAKHRNRLQVLMMRLEATSPGRGNLALAGAYQTQLEDKINK